MRNEVDLVDHRHTHAVAIGQSETATEDLLGKGLGREPAQRDDDADVLDVPPFLELVDAHDGADR